MKIKESELFAPIKQLPRAKLTRNQKVLILAGFLLISTNESIADPLQAYSPAEVTLEFGSNPDQVSLAVPTVYLETTLRSALAKKREGIDFRKINTLQFLDVRDGNPQMGVRIEIEGEASVGLSSNFSCRSSSHFSIREQAILELASQVAVGTQCKGSNDLLNLENVSKVMTDTLSAVITKALDNQLLRKEELTKLQLSDPKIAALLTRGFGRGSYCTDYLNRPSVCLVVAWPPGILRAYMDTLAAPAPKAVTDELSQKCIAPISENERHDWAWQGDEREERWNGSMLWDCIFMYNNLLN